MRNLVRNNRGGRGTCNVQREEKNTRHVSRATLPRLLIRLYQLLLSPWLGVNCRFEPSCSHYAQEALKRHGMAKGGMLALKRVLRCHPWGGEGFDPVPHIESL